MLRRTLTLGFVASLVTAAIWGACSGEQTASPAKDGGAEAGGTGAQGGSSAAGGTLSSGGKGGTGGSNADAGDWGPAPTWEAIPGTAVGCTFERMTNAASIRFLEWEPCTWTDGCEQAVFNALLFGTNAAFTSPSMVVDDGTTVRAGLTMVQFQHRMAMVVGDDGMGLDAIRVTGGKPDCNLAATSIWKQRFAIHVQDPTAAKHFGGILGDVGAMNVSPVEFTIPEPPPVGSTQQLGAGR